MPDINLLGDTNPATSESGGKKRPVSPPRFEMSRPEAMKGVDRPLKKPSSFGLWLRSALTGKPKNGQRPVPPTPPVPQPRVQPKGSPSVRSGNEPVDIFADVGADVGGPARPKPVSNTPGPTGPKPGEFPPLPSMPKWSPQATPAAPQPASPPAPNLPAGAPVSRLQPLGSVRTMPGLPAQKSAPLSPTPARPSGLRIPPLSAARRSGERTAQAEFEAGMNLLPEDLVTSYDPKKKLTTVILVFVAAVLVVGIAYVSLLLWKETVSRRAAETSDRVGQIEAQIRSKDLQEGQKGAVALRDANKTLKKLLDTHIYWTRFLQYFERYTLSTVSFPSGVSATPGGVMTLTGSAPTLQAVVAQMKVYQYAFDFIVAANVNTVTHNVKEGTYTFVADIIFNPAVLLNPITKPTNTNSSQGANINGSTFFGNFNVNATP